MTRIRAAAVQIVGLILIKNDKLPIRNGRVCRRYAKDLNNK